MSPLLIFHIFVFIISNSTNYILKISKITLRGTFLHFPLSFASLRKTELLGQLIKVTHN